MPMVSTLRLHNMMNIADNLLVQKNVFTSKLALFRLNDISTIFIVGLLSCFIFFFPNKMYLFHWFTVSPFEFTFEFKIDMLSKIMFAAVMFIASQVFIFSRHYMLSDFSYQRFMLQLVLTIASVQWLVLSGNLLTAFVGWQMIGLNLYLLLNHYHYKPSANRNAKKKFIVNRLGDVCFLTAVVLAMLNTGNSSFDQLLTIHSSTLILNSIEISTLNLILSLVFVAIMTKSALFPFHIWLPDTMEAPTPVSALMHAGVINSGGYLLARLNNVIIHETNFMLLVFVIGVISLLSGILLKASQYDIKRTLAYSTMSQMGYMIMQIGLGCFSAGVFHLITHGLFKAFLFLNSGNMVVHKNTEYAACAKNLVVPLFISSIIFLGINWGEQLTILDAFIFITLNELISCSYKANLNKSQLITAVIAIWAMVKSYYLLLNLFENVTLIRTENVFDPNIQTLIALCITTIYTLSKFATSIDLPSNIISKAALVLSHNKLYIENIYRKLLINPIRMAGDRLNRIFENISTPILGMLSTGIISILLLAHEASFTNKPLTSTFLITLSILSHLCANRAKSLNKIILFIFIGQTSLLSCLGIYSSHFNLIYLLVINQGLLFLILSKFQVVNSSVNTNCALDNNTLSGAKSIFTTLLFLLVGLPFTPCFLLWLLLIQSSIQSTPLLTPLVLVSNILLCISVFHTFQDYVFTDKKLITLNIKHKNAFCILGMLLIVLYIYLCFFFNESHYS